MITASIVLFNTFQSDIENIVKSYSPSKGRKLYIIDNSHEKNNYCESITCDYIDYYFVGKNIGYGAAHNIGIRKAIEIESKYHIVLNPDIRFDEIVLTGLISYMNDNTDIVYLLPKVIYPNGNIQYLCKLLPTPMDLIERRFLPSIGPFKRRNDKYILKYTGYDKVMNPPCLSGCFMLLRTDVIREHNLFFDESFFMYFEDFDLIRRLHKVGKTIYYPYYSIVHDHAKLSYKSIRMMFIHIISACKYFNKYGWFFDKERKRINKEFIDENSYEIDL